MPALAARCPSCHASVPCPSSRALLLLEQVARMRAAQRAYFADRSVENLRASIAIERHVDELLAELDPAQPYQTVAF